MSETRSISGSTRQLSRVALISACGGALLAAGLAYDRHFEPVSSMWLHFGQLAVPPGLALAVALCTGLLISSARRIGTTALFALAMTSIVGVLLWQSRSATDSEQTAMRVEDAARSIRFGVVHSLDDLKSELSAAGVRWADHVDKTGSSFTPRGVEWLAPYTRFDAFGWIGADRALNTWLSRIEGQETAPALVPLLRTPVVQNAMSRHTAALGEGEEITRDSGALIVAADITDNGNRRGTAIALVTPETLITGVLARLEMNHGVVISDGDGRTLFDGRSADLDYAAQLAASTQLDTHDLTWQLDVIPTARWAATEETVAPEVALAALLLLALAILKTGYLATRRETDANGRVSGTPSHFTSVDHSPLPHVITDRNGMIVEINEAATQTLGNSRETLVGRHLGELQTRDTTGDDRNRTDPLRDAWAELRAGGKPVSLEVSLQCGSRAPRDFSFLLKPSRRGQQDAVVCALRELEMTGSASDAAETAARIEDLERQLADSRQQLEQTGEKLHEELRKELRDQQTRLGESQQQSRDYERELESSRQELAEREAELEKAREELGEQSRQIEGSGHAQHESDGEFEASREKLLENQRQLEQTRQELLDRDERLEDSREKLLDSDRQLESARQKLLDTEERLEAVQHQLTERDREFERSEERYLESSRRLEESRKQLAERDRRIEEIGKRRSSDARQLQQAAADLGRYAFFCRTEPPQVLWASPALEKLHGVTTDQVTAAPTLITDALTPADSEKLLTAFREARHAAGEVEYDVESAAGETLHLRTRFAPIADAAGEVRHIAGLTEDITQQLRSDTDHSYGLECASVLGRLASRLNGVDSDEIDTEIGAALQALATLLDAGHASICMVDEYGESASTLCSAGSESPAPASTGQRQRLDELDATRLRWLGELTAMGRTLVLGSLDEVPAEAAADRSALAAAGVTARIQVPLRRVDGRTGALIIDSVKGPRDWSETERSTVAIAAALVAGALERAQIRSHEGSGRSLSADEKTDDLHDRTLRNLGLCRTQLGELQARIDDGADEDPAALHTTRQLLRDTIEDARSLAFEITSPMLYKLGLRAAIEWIAGRVGDPHGVRFEVMDDGTDKPVEERVAVTVFQAAHAVMTNVGKHAGVNHAVVRLSSQDTMLIIEVMDAGHGFDPTQLGATPTEESPAHESDQDLTSVRESIRRIGGDLEIDSTSGHGTRVVLRAPLANAEHASAS